ncbi:heterokaryon incompatibility protein-domain-containing protein, partial [Immersiella caudata]
MYSYKPLASRTSIRLLCLAPSPDRDAVLKGSLIEADVDHLNRDLIETYTALSYVWGDPARTGEILLDRDEQRLGITASLQNALRDIRDETRELRVWADAICINQDFTNERNSQVSMMGRIYSVATHTIIYLGAPA